MKRITLLFFLFFLLYFLVSNTYSKDGVSVPTFIIKVKLTKNAKEKLNSLGESVKVSLLLYGKATKNSKVKPYPWGDIDLKKLTIYLNRKNEVKFKGILIPKERYNSLKDKNYEVLINVSSGRKKVNENLLRCTIINKKISEVIKNQNIITCKFRKG